jgi:hypothetical protein
MINTITNPKFFFGGNATFTVHNASGDHYTFKAKKSKKANSPVFLSVLTGPNNEDSYTYAGILNQEGSVITTAKSRIAKDAKSVKVAQWAVKQVLKGVAMPEGYGIHHEGTCCRCGRTLTTPESVANGIGPECIKHLK